MKNKIVLYHANCLDGFGAAWAAWKKFGGGAKYIAVDPGTLPEETPIGKKIYALDVSYTIEKQKKLRAKNKFMVILDHHISSKADTEAFPDNVFDNNHSGATLAWKYFHPQKPVPRMLVHIEDIDLWKLRVPRTIEIISALNLVPYEFKAWNLFSRKLETRNDKMDILKTGKVVRAYEEMLIKRLAENPTFVKFEGMKIYSVNSPFLNSYVGNLLVAKLPPMAIIWKEKSGNFYISLRSNGSVDVSKIARKYGGGGHRCAAGFTQDASKPLPWKKIRN